MPDTCRDCNANVLWATTLNGRNMALNATPDPVRGDTFIAAADHGQRLAIHVSRLTVEGSHAAFSAGLRLYRAHAITCTAKRAANGQRAQVGS